MSEGEFGPMPADHTNVGGMPSSQNPDQSTGPAAPPEPPPPEPRPRAQDLPRGYVAKKKKKISFGGGGEPPVEQHSPTKVHVPGWRSIILGGSGGIRVRS